MPVIQTERLVLREFNTEDAAFTLELLNTPTWLQYIGDRNVKNLADARNYITGFFMESYRRFGFGFYLVELKNDHQPIGMCGVVKREFLEDPDIGFGFLPTYAGQGYAYEAAAACLNFALNTLKLNRITAVTTQENNNSRKLIQKLNLYFEKNICWPPTNKQVMLFSNQLN